MQLLMALLVGALYAAGIYLMLRRSVVKLIVGLALLGNAANLLIFTAARLVRDKPPILAETTGRLAEPFADPLPQALILTAIVIGFGVLAFAVVLIHRTVQEVGSDDLDQMKSTDREG